MQVSGYHAGAIITGKGDYMKKITEQAIRKNNYRLQLQAAHGYARAALKRLEEYKKEKDENSNQTNSRSR